jgi:hypothetical protein
MALGSTQPLTEMRPSLEVKTTGVYSWQPYHFHVSNVWKSGKSKPPGALGTYLGQYMDSFTIYCSYKML